MLFLRRCLQIISKSLLVASAFFQRMWDCPIGLRSTFKHLRLSSKQGKKRKKKSWWGVWVQTLGSKAYWLGEEILYCRYGHIQLQNWWESEGSRHLSSRIFGNRETWVQQWAAREPAVSSFNDWIWPDSGVCASGLLITASQQKMSEITSDLTCFKAPSLSLMIGLNLPKDPTI